MSIENTTSLREAIREHRFFRRSPTTKSLLVFAHGFLSRPADYEELLTALLNDEAGPLADCDLLPHRYPAGVFSNTRLHGTSRRLETRQGYESVKLQAEIAARHREHGYDRIYLMGHSMGALLVRATVLEGWRAANGDATAWAPRIARVVLLAGLNRGVVLHKLWHRLGYRFGRFIGRTRLVKDVRRGSDLLNNLRLGWIFDFQQNGWAHPEVVQILGERDRLVSRYDAGDLERSPQYEHILLKDLEHRDFRGITGAHRHYPTIREAFEKPLEAMADALPAQLSDATTLVFLIHGIRDFGEWQTALARTIKARNPGAKVVSIRYGYFNVFQFLIGFQRGRAVRAFTDRYIEEIAELQDKVSNIHIAVAAHSNGTYVLGHALRKYPNLIINRAYLAGSVLPKRFFTRMHWSPLQRQSLLDMRSDRARWDWPVGGLCSGLRFLGFCTAIGVGGYKGFKVKSGDIVLHDGGYLDGGHGAALEPHQHENIASYLLTGLPTQPETAASSHWLMDGLCSFGAVLLYGLIGAVLALYGWGIPWLSADVTFIPADIAQIAASAFLTLLVILLLVRI